MEKVTIVRGLVFLPVLLLGCGGAGEEQEVPRPPNVVLILADDLGYGDVGAYGSDLIDTPNVDALAVDGVRFTAGYVAAAVCSPSRAGLMTGRYPQRHGYEFNPSGQPYRLRADETTLAEILQGTGYATGAVGKWQLGWEDGAHPLDRGFDEFFGMQSGTLYFEAGTEGSESWMPGSEEVASIRRRPLFRGRQAVEESEYLTEAFTREALSFIDRHHTEPFFLYLAHYAPHAPLQATRTYLDRYRHIEDERKRIFAAMVSALDDSVGAVVSALQRHGIEDDTLIVFLSDNGCALYLEGGCSNGPLRGGKRWFFEGGVRVPFVIRWPGRAPSGVTYEPPVSSLDLLPTIAAATGAKLPDKALDGTDLLPYVDGSQDGVPHESLFWRAGPNRAMRSGNWKLWQVNRASAEQLAQIDRGEGTWPGPGALLAGYEAPHGSPLGQLDRLHDLSSDPGEGDDRSEVRGEILERLRQALDTWESELEEPRWWSNRGTAAEIDGTAVEIIF